LQAPQGAGLVDYATDLGVVVSNAGSTFNALRYYGISRAAEKITLNQLPLIAAPTYATVISGAATVLAGKVCAHSNGQLMRCVVGGTVAAAQPTFSASAVMVDGTLNWVATGKNNNIQTGPDVPTISVSTSAPGGTTALPLYTNGGGGGGTPIFSAPVSSYNIPLYSGATTYFYDWIVGGTYSQGNGAGTFNPIAKVEFESDAPTIGIGYINGGTSVRYAVFVDDAPVETDITQITSGGHNWYILTWASRKKRTYRVEINGGQGMDNVAVDTQSFCRPVTKSRLNSIYFGDSYGATISTWTAPALDMRDYLSENLGKALGFAYTRICDLGGAGYINQGSSQAVNLPQAMAQNIKAGWNPQLVIIQAGHNDILYLTAQITAAALAMWQNARALYPLAHIAIIGPIPAATGPSAVFITLDAALQATFATWADGNSSYYPTAPSATSFSLIWGTGNISATTGVGNADFYVGGDTVHPSYAGMAYLVKYFAQQIDEKMTLLGL
jgi:lysophospholipase L1-like esterase